MTTVWLVESGEYEQRGVVGVYASRQAALDGIKKRYGPPYEVRWTIDGDVLWGDFEHVAGYSIKHRADFELTETTVEGALTTEHANA